MIAKEFVNAYFKGKSFEDDTAKLVWDNLKEFGMCWKVAPYDDTKKNWIVLFDDGSILTVNSKDRKVTSGLFNEHLYSESVIKDETVEYVYD